MSSLAWIIPDGSEIFLLTPEEFANLPNGSTVICIDGTEAIKGKDYIDMDVRCGVLAFGLHGPWRSSK